MNREKFNPLEDVFEKPEKGSPLEQDFQSMQRGTLHTAIMFDEESDAHGGEKVNPGTGKPNVNSEVKSTDGLNELDVSDSQDVMGDIKDPSKMTLEELIRTQKND